MTNVMKFVPLAELMGTVDTLKATTKVSFAIRFMKEHMKYSTCYLHDFLASELRGRV